MIHEDTADFDSLLQKSYNELGICGIDNSINYADLVARANNFSASFKDVALSSPHVIVLKTISYFLQSNRVVLTKNELYDFFITSYKFLIANLGETKERPVIGRGSEMIYSIFTEICNDLLSSYDSFNEKIKTQIPNLIVDVLAVIFFKTDPYGKKISVFQIKHYYFYKKGSLMTNGFLRPSTIAENSNEALTSLEGVNSQSQNDAEKIPKFQDMDTLDSNHDNGASNNKKLIRDDDMVYRISQITKRDNTSISQSLTTLTEKDIKKLYDICSNYDKVVKYSELGNLKDFKLAIELDLKRSLSDKQVRHSLASIKKIQYYIENILDRKFEPHLTHGINHVKHNFEYGYRLVGLISTSKPIKRANF
jgi:hypothetical protein